MRVGLTRGLRLYCRPHRLPQCPLPLHRSFGFSLSFPSSSAALDAFSSSLMIMMMESEPMEAIKSLTRPSGELSCVETAQVVPSAVCSAINAAGI